MTNDDGDGDTRDGDEEDGMVINFADEYVSVDGDDDDGNGDDDDGDGMVVLMMTFVPLGP